MYFSRGYILGSCGGAQISDIVCRATHHFPNIDHPACRKKKLVYLVTLPLILKTNKAS